MPVFAIHCLVPKFSRERLRSCACYGMHALIKTLIAVGLIGVIVSFLAERPPEAAQMSSAVAADSADTGAVVVYVTVPDRDTGRKIANSLVEGKLAACVNIIPGLESIYMWEGKVNTDEELLLKIKSRLSLVPSLTAHVKSLHPYTECEVIAVPIVGGSPSYLQWIMDNTHQQQ